MVTACTASEDFKHVELEELVEICPYRQRLDVR
jgi:hypothetical protein